MRGRLPTLALLLLAGCAGSPRSADLKGADDLFRAGRYEEAVRAYRSIVFREPDRASTDEALLQIGIIENLFLRKPNEALEAWSDLVRRSPKSAQALSAHLGLANLYRDKFQVEGKAIAEYERVLKDFPDAPGQDRIRLHLAECYALQGSYDRARGEYQEILRRFPRTDLAPEVLYQIAMSRYLGGDCPAARRDFAEVVRRFPNDPIALEAELSTATCLEEEQDLDGALGMLRGLLERYPNRSVIALKMARIEQRREQRRR